VVDQLEVTKAKARLMAPERWHLTVAFLGDVALSRLESASEAVRAGVAETGAFDLRIAGGGMFGRGTSTVLWAGVAGDLAALRTITLGVRNRLQWARLPYDNKPLQPHVTIARPGIKLQAAALALDTTALGGYAGPSWSVEEVHLMLSETVKTATGPQPHYTTLSTVRLAPRPVNSPMPDGQ
jgi:2'-5' RNA ligase